MSASTIVVLCTGAAMLHCLAYAVAYLGNAGSAEPPPLHKIFTIYREALGVISRAVRKHPTFSHGHNPFDELLIRAVGEYLTFDQSGIPAVQEVAEQAHLEVQKWMRDRQLSYPPSQFNMVDRMYRAWLIQLAILHTVHEHVKTRQENQTANGWREVLGLGANERNHQVVRKAFRKLSSQAHPDKGGSNEHQAALNKAWAQAREELGFV